MQSCAASSMPPYVEFIGTWNVCSPNSTIILMNGNGNLSQSWWSRNIALRLSASIMELPHVDMIVVRGALVQSGGDAALQFGQVFILIESRPAVFRPLLHLCRVGGRRQARPDGGTANDAHVAASGKPPRVGQAQ